MGKLKKIGLIICVVLLCMGIILLTDYGKMKKYQNGEVTDLAALEYRQMQISCLMCVSCRTHIMWMNSDR